MCPYTTTNYQIYITMRTLRFVFVWLVPCLLFACSSAPEISNTNEQDVKTYQVNPDQAQPQGVASEIFSHYTFVPLETPKGHLVGSIDEIIPYKGNYYILDKQSKAIFAFDGQGKFVFKIVSEGRGPGEYTGINHIAIDTAQSKIVAMCLEKVICYNLTDGRFVKDATFKTGVPEAMLASEIFCHYQYNVQRDGSLNNLKIITKNKVLAEYFPINPDFKGYSLRGNRFFTGNPSRTVYVNDYLSDTVYEVTPTRLIARTVVDFGAKQINAEGIRQLGQAQTASFLAKAAYCSDIRDYFETPSILQFSYGYEGRMYTWLYSKKNQTAYHYKGTWFDDIVYGIIPERWVFANDSAFLTWKDASQFLREQADSPEYYRAEIAKQVAEKKDPALMARYENQLKQYSQVYQKAGIDILKDEDNPVLIWMHFNEKFR